MVSEEESAAVLEARGLSVAYGKGSEPVLFDVDLALGAGELVCVLGPNGAGKSTLLRALGGLVRPSRGEVLLRGGSLGALGARRRAREIATVPQKIAALPEVGVDDFVLGGRYPHMGFWGTPREADRLAVEAALAEADAGAFRGRLLHELSGGQCQRVLLARALAQEAAVLLFDEPTASLDPEHQVRVFQSIARLVGGGKSALIATHEINLASRFASRVVLLADGRVQAAGTPEEVFVPAVLGPVYGSELCFARAPAPLARPLVFPWPAPERGSPRPEPPPGPGEGPGGPGDGGPPGRG